MKTLTLGKRKRVVKIEKNSPAHLALVMYESNDPFPLVDWIAGHVDPELGSDKFKWGSTRAVAQHLIQLVNAYANLVRDRGTREVDKKHGAVEV